MFILPGKVCPHPFPIPTFRPSTAESLLKKVLTDADRKYMVRTLSTILMTYVTRPGMEDCNIVAKALVHEWKFLNDGEGEGQVC